MADPACRSTQATRWVQLAWPGVQPGSKTSSCSLKSFGREDRAPCCCCCRLCAVQKPPSAGQGRCQAVSGAGRGGGVVDLLRKQLVRSRRAREATSDGLGQCVVICGRSPGEENGSSEQLRRHRRGTRQASCIKHAGAGSMQLRRADSWQRTWVTRPAVDQLARHLSTPRTVRCRRGTQESCRRRRRLLCTVLHVTAQQATEEQSGCLPGEV